MSLNDAYARFTGRLGPNAPTIALNPEAVLMRVAKALLAEAEDVRAKAAAITPALHVDTAQGTDLVQLAADKGVPVGTGHAASATGVFTVQTAAATAQLIQAGTVVFIPATSTGVAPILYQSLVDVVLSAGATQSPAVTVTCAQLGAIGNAAAPAITQTRDLPGVGFTQQTDAVGGVNPDSEDQIRAAIRAALAIHGGTAAVETAILAVSGVYDAQASDPQDGTGHVSYLWSDNLGLQAQIGLAAAVQAAALGAVDLTTILQSGTFTVVALTDVEVSYRAPVAVVSASIEPTIIAAVAAYVQGDGVTPRSGLIHGQPVDSSGAFMEAQEATGYVVTSLTITATTPAATAPTPTTLYRLTGNPASVIHLTRLP